MPRRYMTSSVVILLFIMVTSLVQSAKLRNNHKRGLMAGADVDFKWIGGIVPFCFLQLNVISQINRRIIMDAMAEIMSKSCIKFVPRHPINWQCEIDDCRPNDDTVKQFKMLVVTGAHPGSYVEDVGIPTFLPCRIINLDNRCIKRPIVLHHLMHALGFGHENARSDRDQYLKMDRNNKVNRHCELPNKYDDLNVKMDLSNTIFDQFSIMTSGENEFRDVDPNQLGDVPVTLSPTDVLELNKIYNCDVCVNFHYDFKCIRWAMSYRYCSSSYMQTYCRKSCKLCNEPQTNKKPINESVPRPFTNETSAIVEATVVPETKISIETTAITDTGANISVMENETATTEIPDITSKTTVASSELLDATSVMLAFVTEEAAIGTTYTVPVPTNTTDAINNTIDVTTGIPIAPIINTTETSYDIGNPIATATSAMTNEPTTTVDATSQTFPVPTAFPTMTSEATVDQIATTVTLAPTTTMEETAVTNATNELSTVTSTIIGFTVSETSEETRMTPIVATTAEILATIELTRALPTTEVSEMTKQTSRVMIEVVGASIATSEAISTSTRLLGSIEEFYAGDTEISSATGETIAPTAEIATSTNEANGSISEVIIVPTKVIAIVDEATNASADNGAE